MPAALAAISPEPSTTEPSAHSLRVVGGDGPSAVLRHRRGGQAPLPAPRLSRWTTLVGTDDFGLQRTAEVLRAGGIAAFPFNGIYVLYGDADNPAAGEMIADAKNRPHDKRLAQTCLPEAVDELADLAGLPFGAADLAALWRDVFALGVILPAPADAPAHLATEAEGPKTIMPVWTEYAPLRRLMEHFRRLGGRLLVGTSANKAGEATHTEFADLWPEFKGDVHISVRATIPPPVHLRDRPDRRHPAAAPAGQHGGAGAAGRAGSPRLRAAAGEGRGAPGEGALASPRPSPRGRGGRCSEQRRPYACRALQRPALRPDRAPRRRGPAAAGGGDAPGIHVGRVRVAARRPAGEATPAALSAARGPRRAQAAR